MSEATLRAAVGLFRSDSRHETFLAIGLVAVVVAPIVLSYLQNRRGRMQR